MFPTCAISAFILFVVMPMKPDTDILVSPHLYHPMSLTAVKDVVLRLNIFHSISPLMLAIPNVCFTFQSWARNEAVARNKLESEGVELKYGHFYAESSNPKFVKKIGEVPFISQG